MEGGVIIRACTHKIAKAEMVGRLGTVYRGGGDQVARMSPLSQPGSQRLVPDPELSRVACRSGSDQVPRVFPMSAACSQALLPEHTRGRGLSARALHSMMGGDPAWPRSC